MEYRTARDIKIPKGTALVYPAPPAKEPVTYGHAVHCLTDDDAQRFEGDDVAAHFAIPLDAAIKAGLVEEIK